MVDSMTTTTLCEIPQKKSLITYFNLLLTKDA